jgi:hypothetical protein
MAPLAHSPIASPCCRRSIRWGEDLAELLLDPVVHRRLYNIAYVYGPDLVVVPLCQESVVVVVLSFLKIDRSAAIRVKALADTEAKTEYILAREAQTLASRRTRRRPLFGEGRFLGEIGGPLKGPVCEVVERPESFNRDDWCCWAGHRTRPHSEGAVNVRSCCG